MAVLFSILIAFLLLALVAIVIDLGALRADRRATQVTADVAALSGAMSLRNVASGKIGGSPREACEAAWRYFLFNTPEADQSATPPCGTFPTSSTCDPLTSHEARRIAEPYEVIITWPVQDLSLLMEGLGDGQGYDPEVDGDPCERLGVNVFRRRGFVFGSVFGSIDGLTGAAAVARPRIGKEEKVVVGLVVLDPYGCETLLASGGGSNGGGVWVWEGSDERPGIISVDSNGRDCGGNYVVDRSGGGGAPAEIKAGVTGVNPATNKGIVGDNGIITVHALGAGECMDCGFQQADVDADAVAPEPFGGETITRKPALHRWNCKDDYPLSDDPVPHLAVPACEGTTRVPANSSYIDNLEAFVTGAAPDPAAAGFEVMSACTISDVQTWTLPAGKHGFWVDCPGGFRVDGTVHVPEGNVMVNGSLQVRGTFRSNATSPPAGGCSNAGADPNDPSDDISHDNWMAVRGDLVKTNTGAQLELGHEECRGTAVLLINGMIDFAGGSSVLRWFAPYVGKMERGPHFDLEDLSMWSESTAEHRLAGDASNLEIEGVFYIPNADGGDGFEYAGNGAMGQQKAQFFTYRIWAHGNGKLSMTPDPERALETYKFEGVSLIR